MEKICQNCIFWKRCSGKGIENKNTKFGHCSSKIAFTRRDPDKDGSVPEETNTASVFLDDGEENLFWIKTGENHSCPAFETSESIEQKVVSGENHLPPVDASNSTISACSTELFGNIPNPECCTRDEIVKSINENMHGYSAKKGDGSTIVISQDETENKMGIVPGSFKKSGDEIELNDDGKGRLFDQHGNHVQNFDYTSACSLPPAPLPEDQEMFDELCTMIKEESRFKCHGYKNEGIEINKIILPFETIRPQWEFYKEIITNDTAEDEEKQEATSDFMTCMRGEIHVLEEERIKYLVDSISTYLDDNIEEKMKFPYSYMFNHKQEAFVMNGFPFFLDWCIEAFENEEKDLLDEMKTRMAERVYTKNEIKEVLSQLGVTSYTWLKYAAVATCAFVVGVFLSDKIMGLF